MTPIIPVIPQNIHISSGYYLIFLEEEKTETMILKND